MSTFSDALHTVEKDVEAWGEAELAALHSALDAVWPVLKASIVSIGKTGLSQVLVAAGTVVTGSATASQALASVEGQLVGDATQAAVAGRAAAAGALATVIASLAATPASTAP